VKTSFTYLADTVIEVIVDGDSVTWNVLPAEPSLPQPEQVSVETPLAALELSSPEPASVVSPIECAAAPAPSKKRRTLMGVIRAAWFIVFTGAGAVVDYGIANLTDLPLPPGTATVIGGVLYGAKRAIWPNTTI
jgi:hypothetical protein